MCQNSEHTHDHDDYEYVDDSPRNLFKMTEVIGVVALSVLSFGLLMLLGQALTRNNALVRELTKK